MCGNGRWTIIVSMDLPSNRNASMRSNGSTIQTKNDCVFFWFRRKLVAKVSIWLVHRVSLCLTHRGIHRMIVSAIGSLEVENEFNFSSWIFLFAEQSVFRVFRMGQTRKCYIYRLLAMGTMEEKVYSRSVTKQATSCRVVDKQQIERHYNMAELVELYEWVCHRRNTFGFGRFKNISNPCRLTKPNIDERPVPNMPKDKLLAFLLEKHKDIIFKYQEHESLLAEIEETVLTEEQKEALWSEYRLQETSGGQVGFTHRRHGDYDDFSFSDTGDESEHSLSAQSHLSSPHASSSSSGSPMPKRFFSKRSFGGRPHFSASKNKKRNPKSAKKPKKFWILSFLFYSIHHVTAKRPLKP